jgi:hypothetical protein
MLPDALAAHLQAAGNADDPEEEDEEYEDMEAFARRILGRSS